MLLTIGSLIRSAGANTAGNNNPTVSGISLGGIYYPGYTDASGKAISARWEGSFYDNTPGTDGQPDRNTVIRITAWNGANAKEGGGLADICAKYISAGKEIVCHCTLTGYKSRVFVDGKAIVNAAGAFHLEPKIGFRMQPGTLRFGRDSAKQIAMEYQNWARNPGKLSFFSRPPQWDVPGSMDERVWREQILPWRKAQVYQGGDTYGYAMVRSTGQATGKAANSNIRSTEGYTIDQYRNAKWTDELMLADQSGKFAPFIAAGLIGANLNGPMGPGAPSGPSGPGNVECGPEIATYGSFEASGSF